MFQHANYFLNFQKLLGIAKGVKVCASSAVLEPVCAPAYICKWTRCPLASVFLFLVHIHLSAHQPAATCVCCA